MDIPQFIFSILEQELLQSHERMLEKIADHYGYDLDDLREIGLPSQPMEIVPQEVIRVQVKKCYQPRVPPPEEERCMGRIWNRGLGGQCTRRRCDNTEHCRLHQKTLKYGRVDEPLPEDLFRKPSTRESIHGNGLK